MFDGMNIQTNGSMLDITAIRSDGELIGTSFTLYLRHNNLSYSLSCIAFDVDMTADYDEWQMVNITGQISYYSNYGTWQLIVENID